MTKNRKGTLFVLSGPSGAGKGTIRARVFEALDGLSYSVSCTTRAPREGERDGVDYRFITPEDFAARIAAGDFLEWADVHRHRYGTLKSDVEKVLNEGKDMFLEIDVQGALQVKKKMPEAVTLFVVPPSIEVLEERLRGRRSEGEAELRLRLR
ncbi:guanylate kinase, partial [Pyramidobacter piscolens]